MMPPRLSIHTEDEVLPSPGKGKTSTPMFALAPAAMEEQAYFSGQNDDQPGISEVWHVIAKASMLVKDGHRLENLAWRNWSQQRRQSTHPPLHCDTTRRTLSFTSTGSDSTASLSTPGIEMPPSPTTSTCSRSERQTFTDALRRLMPENEFTDWVSEARVQQKTEQHVSPPILSVPDTPIANLEIRLVEPTPVPSRVGSLGGSINASGLLAVTTRPPRLTEEPEAEEVVEHDEAESESEVDEVEGGQSSDGLRIRARPKPVNRHSKKKGKFFVHSSPSKGSGSDSATSPSTLKSPPTVPAEPVQPPSPSTSAVSRMSEDDRRRSSVSSAGAVLATRKKSPRSPEKRRHVSLSTMRGRFTAEKRRAAEVLERKAEEEQARAMAEAEAAAAAEAEGSGWEDDEEEEEEEGDWSDDDDDEEGALQAGDTNDEGHETGSETAYGRRRSRHRWPELRDPPPPPAPTPLKQMSLTQRQAAKAERDRIEAELEAQQKREMFAKQQIFGTQKPVNSEGLLSGIFKRGASMVNLLDQTPGSPPLRPCPTHGNLPNLALAKSPLIHTPNLLRSKSAVAMPVQTGISVTRVSPKRSRLSEEIGSAASVDRASSQSPDITTEVRRSRPHRSSDNSSKSAKSHTTSSSKERKIPEDVELESDSDEEEEDQYLATSSTRQKLEQLSAKAEAKGKARDAEQANPSYGGVALAQPVPMAVSNIVLDERGVVMPMTPVTRRRAVLQRELSESLRRNLILERQKSSGGQKRHASFGPVNHNRPPPSTHTSLLPARHSSANLANHPVLSRHRSDRSDGADGRTTPQSEILRSSPSPHQPEADVAPPVEHMRRRTQPNVLGGFLRPLTRVGIDGVAPRVGFVEPEMPQRDRRSHGEMPYRTQSSTDLTTTSSQANSLSPSPNALASNSRTGSHANLASTAVGLEQGYEAPAMLRRATEGPHGQGFPHPPRAEWSDDIARRRELVRRSVAQDNGYRTHGW